MSVNVSKLSFKEIFDHLPHRPPFLLIDRVVEMVPAKSLVAIKNVTINEPFFVGHFPQHPIMPGVLILEALAQAATILASMTLNKKPDEKSALYFFAGIDNARFKRIVVPGDQLKLSVEITKMRQHVIMIKAEASVDDELACSADLISARREVEK